MGTDAFKPVTVYDIPDVVAGQAVTGQLSPLRPRESLERVWRTAFSPGTLSPHERRELSTLLADRTAGGNAAVDTLFSLASNPLVWMAVFTGPAGFRALQSGKSIFAVADKNSWHTQALSWFKRTFMSVFEATRGSAIPQIALQAKSRYEGIVASLAEINRPTRTRLLEVVRQRAGPEWGPKIRSLDLWQHQHLKGTPAWEALSHLYDTMFVTVGRLDQGLTRNVRRSAGHRRGFYDTTTGEIRWVDEITSRGATLGGRSLGTQTRASDYLVQLLDEDEVRAYFAMGKRKRGEFQRRFVPVEELTDTPYFKEEALVEWSTPLVENLEAVAAARAEYGGLLDEVIATEAEVRRRVYVEVLGDTDHYASTSVDLIPGVKGRGQLKIDDDKLIMLLSAVGRYRKGLDVKDYEREAIEGLKLLEELVSPPRFAQLVSLADDTIKGGVQLTKPKLKRIVEEARKVVSIHDVDWVDDLWLPRSSRRHQKVLGRRHGSQDPMAPMDPNVDLHELNPELPQGRSGWLSNHAAPRTSKEWNFDHTDLMAVKARFGLSKEGEAFARRNLNAATDVWNKSKGTQALRSHTGDVFWANDEYTRSLSRAALETTPVDDSVVAADAAYFHLTDSQARTLGEISYFGGEFGFPLSQPLQEMFDAHPLRRRRFSLGMALDREIRLAGGTDRAAKQSYLRNVVRPAITEGKSFEQNVALATAEWHRQLADRMANGWFGQNLSKYGGKYGKHFVDQLKNIAESDRILVHRDPSGKIAQWFYLTHLGGNMASVILNLTQSFVTVAPHVHLRDLFGAYGDAVKEISKYVALRNPAAKGAFIPAGDKLKIMQEAFPFMGATTEGRNILRIGPDFYQVIDDRLVTKTGRFDKTFQLLMAMFEKSEWVNRSIAAHALKRSYLRTGRYADEATLLKDPSFLSDAERFVFQTQFGASALNSPGLFLSSPIMSNTAIRQFMSFPLRSFTHTFLTGPTMAGSDSYWKAAFNQWARGLGTSAILYETGKGLLGADFSRGLFAQSVTEVAGGRNFLETTTEGPIVSMIPPVVDVPTTLLRGALTGDDKAVLDGVARLIPGGVALRRMIDVGPQWPRIQALGELPGKMQQTYADWTGMQPGGLVPVHRGSDGALVEHRHWSELMGRAVGLDLGAWREHGALDNYLMKQRDEMVALKHEYLRRLRANDIRGAHRAQAEWGRRFKDPNGNPLPLKVTKAQMQSFLRNQMVGRTERILDRLDPNARPEFAGLVSETGYARNLTRDGLTAAPTARGRDPYRMGGPDLDAMLAEMLGRQEAVGGGATP